MIENYIISDIFPLCNIDSSIQYIDRGSKGCVYTVTSTNMLNSLNKLLNLNKSQIKNNISRLTDNIPNLLAMKVQQFTSKNKYWEARVMREETIMSELSIYDFVPKFYLGCTIIIPLSKITNVITNEIIGIRLTFMDRIEGISLYQLILNKQDIPNISDIVNIVYNLWKIGVSHNDLSIKNIFVIYDRNEKKDKIKLIDFGLSTKIHNNYMLVNPNKKQFLNEIYIDYFLKLDKTEQNGSNVEKLNELRNLFEQYNKDKSSIRFT